MLKSGTELVLTPGGTYSFKSVTVEPGARLSVAAGPATRLFVENGITIKGEVQSLANLMLAQVGDQRVDLANSIRAQLLAPSAFIEVAPGLTVYGAVIGKSVELHQGSRVILQHFPELWVPN